MDNAIKATKAWEYSERVLSGDTVACEWIKLAAKRYQNDLKRSDLIYDLNKVEMITQFFEEVLHVPELGRPEPLPLPAAFWFQQLYGFHYRDTGLRRFTDMLLEMARKNAKTYFAAGLSIYEMILGDDPYPMIMQGANSRDQALICTDMAGKLIKVSPGLREIYDNGNIVIFTYRKKTIEIVYEEGGRIGRIEAMPKDPGDGSNPSNSIVDEFHEATDISLLETMKSGQGARKQPLNTVISSPGHNKQGPLYSVLREQSIRMLRGITVDDSLLAFLYEQDKEEDWDNLDYAEKANPMIPYFPTLKPYLNNRIKDAKNKGGATQVNVKIKNCGVWTDSAAIWIPDEDILQNTHGIKVEELKGRTCYMGIDLSKAKDLTVVTYTFPEIKPGIHALYVQCHIPREKIDSNEDKVDYQKWADEGWLIIHDGNVIDHDIVAEKALEFMATVMVKGIGFDAKYAYQGVITTLSKAGYEELMTPIGQGFALATAVTEWESLLLKHRFELFGNPITRWNFGNVIMKEGDQGHRYPSKSKSANKIDIITAGLTGWTEKNHRHAEGEKQIQVVWF